MGRREESARRKRRENMNGKKKLKRGEEGPQQGGSGGGGGGGGERDKATTTRLGQLELTTINSNVGACACVHAVCDTLAHVACKRSSGRLFHRPSITLTEPLSTASLSLPASSASASQVAPCLSLSRPVPTPVSPRSLPHCPPPCHAPALLAPTPVLTPSPRPCTINKFCLCIHTYPTSRLNDSIKNIPLICSISSAPSVVRNHHTIYRHSPLAFLPGNLLRQIKHSSRLMKTAHPAIITVPIPSFVSLSTDARFVLRATPSLQQPLHHLGSPVQSP